ncbi:site-2 protease family protein [Candidatus Woesearchaeota archaeon]|nr:site-2 protease family protein [Candidatus Woesearchaeota archaeon]MCF7901685.1 site-2 protease family protein [Candidatus Woesearchaeota archaeon]MCF8014053.1 site-2 protease family protein [Candidatus Woesearchaeota archaeon]
MTFEWFWDWGIVVLFYVGIIALIYFNRKKFEIEGKIIALYKTKIGLNLMDKMARPLNKKLDRFGRILFFVSFYAMILFFVVVQFGFSWAAYVFYAFIVLFLVSIVVFKQYISAGNVGIYVGFIGMILMVYLMGVGLYTLVFFPDAPATFSPLLPGIQIPGSPFKLPLLEGLIALFVVVVVHEFSHGIVSRAHKVKVKSSGFVLLGPIPGAFVEPDEKQLKKKSKNVQLSVFAAGPWSNIVLSFFLMLIILFAGLGTAALYEPTGVEIVGFINSSDNLNGGRLVDFSVGEVITQVNGVPVVLRNNLSQALINNSPGDVVSVLTNEGEKSLLLESNPVNASLPFIGISVNHRVESKSNSGFVNFMKGPIFWLFGNPYDTGLIQNWGLIGLIYAISIGIGLVNLLPIGPTDGGRMYLLALEKYMDKKKAMKVWSRTASVLILVLVILIFVPILKSLFVGLL